VGRGGLAGEVEQESGQVPQVGQVCGGLGRLFEDLDGVAGQCRVDAGLEGDDVGAGGGGGDGGEVVLALSGGSRSDRVPADERRADTAQVGVALVAKRAPAGRARGHEQVLVAGAGGDEQEPPGALPGSGLGEAGRADLGAVGGGPAAGGDLPVGVPVVRVEPVKSSAVPSKAAKVAPWTA